LQVLLARAVPDEPRDAVGFGGRPEERDLVGQAVGEVVDMFDLPGEGVA
jgi:hypothetical protein